MKSNYLMLKDLQEWYPKRHGIISGEEVQTIKETLHLDKMDDLGLQNLRDFAVLYYSHKGDDYASHFDQMDKMSAIVSVIDQEKANRGLGV